MQPPSTDHASRGDSVNAADAVSPGITTADSSPAPKNQLQPQLHSRNRATMRAFLSEMQSMSLDGSSDDGSSIGGPAYPAVAAMSPKSHTRGSPAAQHCISDALSARHPDSEDDTILTQVTLLVALTAHFFGMFLHRLNACSGITRVFQLRLIEESMRLTPSPRPPNDGLNDSAGIAATASPADNDYDRNGHQTSDDDAVAIAAMTNAAADADSNSSGSNGESSGSDDDAHHASTFASGAAAVKLPDDDDVQRLLIQVPTRNMTFNVRGIATHTLCFRAISTPLALS